MLFTLLKQLFSTRKGVTHWGGVIDDHVAFAGRLVHHESTAHGVIHPRRQQLSLLVKSREAHPVGMKGKGLGAMHDQVIAIIERDLMRTQQRQIALLTRGRHSRLNPVDIDGIR